MGRKKRPHIERFCKACGLSMNDYPHLRIHLGCREAWMRIRTNAGQRPTGDATPTKGPHYVDYQGTLKVPYYAAGKAIESAMLEDTWPDPEG